MGSYEKDSQLSTLAWAESKLPRNGSSQMFRVSAMEFLADTGQPSGVFHHGDHLRLRMRYEVGQKVDNLNFVVACIRSDGVACCNHITALDGFEVPAAAGLGVLELRTPPIKLVAELYQIHVLIRDKTFQHMYAAQQGPSFHVRDQVLSPHFGVFHEAAEWSWARQ
jgi:lipopolysaccharide transport system ATP-binding protein